MPPRPGTSPTRRAVPASDRRRTGAAAPRAAPRPAAARRDRRARRLCRRRFPGLRAPPAGGLRRSRTATGPAACPAGRARVCGRTPRRGCAAETAARARRDRGRRAAGARRRARCRRRGVGREPPCPPARPTSPDWGAAATDARPGGRRARRGRRVGRWAAGSVRTATSARAARRAPGRRAVPCRPCRGVRRGWPCRAAPAPAATARPATRCLPRDQRRHRRGSARRPSPTAWPGAAQRNRRTRRRSAPRWRTGDRCGGARGCR